MKDLTSLLPPMPPQTHFPGWTDIPYFTADQLRARDLEVARLVAEECAKVCEVRAAEHEAQAKLGIDVAAHYAKHERRCAAAIREAFK